jgi:hypothetical protein
LVIRYIKAVEDCKVNSDVIWQISSQEGQAIATFLKNSNLEENKKPKYLKQAAEGLATKLGELSTGYLKSALPLLAFRTILQSGYIFRALGQQVQFLTLLSSSCELLDSMNRRDFEIVITIILKHYDELNLKRKKAILSQKLANHYASENISLAIGILESCVFPSIGITSKVHTSWSRIAFNVTKHGIDLVLKSKDKVLQILYYLLHLKYASALLGERQQKEFIGHCASLSKEFPILESRSLCSLAIPEIISGTKLILDETICHSERERTPSVFIQDFKSKVKIKSRKVVIANEAFQVEFQLQNPFSVDLQIGNFTLQSSSSAFFCEAYSFELQSREKLTFTLNVSVTEPGHLSITNVHFILFSIPFILPLNLPPIEVYQEQPYIKIIESNIRNEAISLLEGERVTLKFKFKNSGIKLAKQMNLSIKPSWIHEDHPFSHKNRSISSLLFRKQESPIQSQTDVSDLTINPDEEFEIKVDLVGIIGLKNLQFILSYSGEELLIVRIIEIDILTNILETFIIESFQVLSFNPVSFTEEDKASISFFLKFKCFDKLNLDLYSNGKQFGILESEDLVRVCFPFEKIVYPTQGFQEAIKELDLSDDKLVLLNKIKGRRKEKENEFFLEAIWATFKVLNAIKIKWEIPEQNRRGELDFEEVLITKAQLPLIYKDSFSIGYKINVNDLEISITGHNALLRVQAYSIQGVSLYNSAEQDIYREIISNKSLNYSLPPDWYQVLICATNPINKTNTWREIIRDPQCKIE